MITRATLVRGRAAILAAAGDHPYARLFAGRDDELSGYLLDDATIWTGPGPHGLTGYASGDAGQVARLAADLLSAGALGDLRWLHLPRLDAEVLETYLTVTHRDDWDFRWTVTPPPVQPGEERVERLTEVDHDAITELVDSSFPTSTTRPGDPRVRAWYGIRSGDRVLAAGADRGRGGTGFLAGIAVAVDARGQGLGAALTAAMTRRLLDEAEEVTLGVLTDNFGAIRLYERLGFAGALPRTSVALAPSALLGAGTSA
ncbi:GNAT family N-acetyltransferase [Micromonospora sp. NPDC050417]|uniref:GNAT family N-acetyltransferase n=1 Tax=Micromonospora sp. NPDC050417 TaxID=3364280 RepID=UPI003790CA25